MRVALLVDHAQRDLAGLTLVAAELTSRNVKCAFVPSDIALQELQALAPDVVVLNYLRQKQAGLYQHLLDQGIRLVVLDTEGGIYPSLERFKIGLLEDKQLRGRIWKYLCWGEKTKHELIEDGFYREDQVALTGCPRFDYYCSPFKQAAVKLSSNVKNYRRPIVLINGNFSKANPKFATAKGAISAATQDGFLRDDIQKIQDLQWESLNGLVKLTKNLAKHFPQVSFVYRPHPFESEKVYVDNFNGINNIYVTKEGNITGWILESSAIIHRGCTTAVEGSFVGVPVLFPSWVPGFARFQATEKVSTLCKSETEMLTILGAIIHGTFEIPKEILANRDQVISDFFYKIDGKSYQRVANQILLARRERSSSILRTRRLIHSTVPVRRQVTNHLRKLVGKQSLSIQRPSELVAGTEKLVSRKALDEVLAALSQCDGSFTFQSLDASSGVYPFGNNEGFSLSIIPTKSRRKAA